MILPYFSDYCLYSHYLLMGYELMGVREGFDDLFLHINKIFPISIGSAR